MWWYRWVSILTAVLLLIQPILAGQFSTTATATYVDIHEMMGNVIFLTVAGQLALAFLARRTYGVGLVGHNAGTDGTGGGADRARLRRADNEGRWRTTFRWACCCSGWDAWRRSWASSTCGRSGGCQ